MTVQDTDRQTFEQQWADWHRDHEARLNHKTGFLAITSINWLSEDPQSFDDAPGIWRTGPDGPSVLLSDDEELIVDGVRAGREYAFGNIPERGSIMAVSGDAVIEVARRGGNDIIRPRHP